MAPKTPPEHPDYVGHSFGNVKGHKVALSTDPVLTGISKDSKELTGLYWSMYRDSLVREWKR